MPISDTDVAGLLDTLRRIGGEPENVEAKRGAGGFPTSLRETLVAFANTDGGTILVGVDEEEDFTLVDLRGRVAGYRDNLVALARDAVTPPLTISTDVVEVAGHQLLVAQVPALPAVQRPAYVTAKGVTTGAYVRTGDGDRRMSEGEIGLLYGSRTQPVWDQEAVEGTGVADLDWNYLRRTIDKVRAGSRRLVNADETTILHRIGVLAERREDSPLTLAGYLTFGDYPQQHFPQLMVSVVVFPPEGSPEATTGRIRFLDNVSVRGPIPDLVEDALAVVRRNLAVRAVMSDTGRRDVLEFPLEGVREALVNALLHRDYSPLSRGTQVQVELHPDRLTIKSPGGLYGGLSTEDLGDDGASSSRNAVLAALLADTYLPRSQDLVAENRRSGIPTMLDQARRNGLPRPVFKSTILGFTVTMGRSELLSPDTRRWIAETAGHLPTPLHDIALAMLRTGPITNAVLREWGATHLEAGRVLRDLTEAGLVVREGGRRYARYHLDLTARRPPQQLRLPDPENASGPARGSGTDRTPALDRLITALRDMRDASAEQIRARTGLSRPTVGAHLRTLIQQGLVEADGPRTSPKRRYRWVGTPEEEQP